MTKMLGIGDKAPDFVLVDQSGESVRLSGFSGKTVIVYFYPRDNTPGCTKEACSFRDAYDDILAKGAVVLGISPDSTDSHVRFRDRHGLPFHLLSDPDHAVAAAYGAWGEKKLYGKAFQGIVRSTFLIGPAGNVVRVWGKVKPEGHGAEILSAL